MSTTTLTVAPETLETPPINQQDKNWTMTFDVNADEHCFGDLDTIIHDMPATVRHAIGITEATDITDLTRSETRSNIDSALEDAQEELDETDPDADPTEHARLTALVEALEDAQGSLETCTQCQCGMDAWDSSEKDWFNSSLAATSDATMWAVFDSGDTPCDETNGAPTVSELWKALNSRDGWSEVTLTWDDNARTLAFTFGAYPGNWHGKAIALTAEQVELTNELYHLDTYQPAAACCVARVDAAAVRVVLNMWGDEDNEDLHQLCLKYDGDPQAAVASVNETMAGLTPETRAAAVMLSDGWTSTVEDLIATASTITA